MESHDGRRILPYGDTLHYNDCGCPEIWAPGTRSADMVDLLAQVIVHCFSTKAGRFEIQSDTEWLLQRHAISDSKCLSFISNLDAATAAACAPVIPEQGHDTF